MKTLGNHFFRNTSALLTATAALALTACAQDAAPELDPPIKFDQPISVSHAGDGGLRPVIGTHNIQVYRANRLHTSHLDGLNHTYTHAPNLAYWHGKYHLDFLSAPVSEHDSPTPTSYTSSANGVDWEQPRLIFPTYELPDGSHPLTHQRMSFFIAPNDKLLATAFYGLFPRPNDGSGIGRAVREVKDDGSFGPIYFLRYNSQEGWDPANAAHFPFYTASKDKAFVAACDALLANKLMTAQWWEEDQSEDGFYREKGKALSYYHLPSGKVVGIWKNAVTMTSDDEGESWIRTGFAQNIPINASKYWIEKTKDDRYALVFNPTTRLRHPLAIATSDDGEHFSDLLAVHGEHADIRYWGKYKSMGPQYVRGILEGNGTPPNSDLWLTYSVNKEDIWVSRVPTPVTSATNGPIHDDFESSNKDGLPATWNVYRPLWAPTQIVDTHTAQNSALELSDEDPYDYASVTRVFQEGRSSLIRFKLLAKQTNGRLEIDVASATGLRPVQIAFTENGTIEAKHEGAWKPGGTYKPNEWLDVELDVNPGQKDHERFQLRINGEEVLYRIAYFSDFPATTERLTFRTGQYRPRGAGGIDLPNPDTKTPKTTFLIDDVSIEPNR